jgi:tetratricopeptide (TPR) repeat protein
MGIKSRRAVVFVAVAFLLVAGGLLALYLTSNRREVTTSSQAAYEAYRQGIENLRRYYRKDAQVDFAKALSLDPNFAMAMVRLAGLSNQDQAKSLIERARRLRDRLNERERLWLDLASMDEKASREDRLRILRAIREKYPDDIDATQMIAMYQMSEGRTEEAIHTMMGVLAQDPNNAEVYNQCGYYYAYRGEYDKAIDNLKKYQFMAPNQANPYDSLGEIQAYSGRYDEAIANLNKALSLKPDFFDSNAHLAVAFEGKGDSKKAIEYYLKAARDSLTEGKRMEYYLAALWAALDSGDKATARDVAARVAELPKGKDTEIRKLAVDAILDLLEGRPAEAEKKLTELHPKVLANFEKENYDSHRKPHFPRWNMLMALAKERQGRTDEAIALYEKNVNPPYPWDNFGSRRWVFESRARLAALLAQKGDVDQAEKLLAENRAWNPNWAPTKEAELTVAAQRREKVNSATGQAGDRQGAR